MHFLNHKVKILLHIMTGLFNWWEYKENLLVLAEAKKIVQKSLKPGMHPGGSASENLGTPFNIGIFFHRYSLLRNSL